MAKCAGTFRKASARGTAKGSTHALDAAQLELVMTFVGAKRPVSELRVKKFLILTCCMAAFFLCRALFLQSLSVTSLPTKRNLISKRVTTTVLCNAGDGWSSHTQDRVLQYVGPLPVTCACSTVHPSLQGLATKGGFKSSLAQSLGPQFWARILSNIEDSQLHCTLRNGGSSVPCSSAGIIPLGHNCGYGFSLSAAQDSVAAHHEAWKANTLTRSILRNFSASWLHTFFVSRGFARDTVFLLSPLSSGCKFLESLRGSRGVSGLLGVCVALISESGNSGGLSGDASVHSVPGMSSDIAVDSQFPLDLGVAVAK